MQKQKSNPQSKTAGGILAGFSTLFFIGILILIQLISIRHNKRIDLTSNQRFTLSPQTIQILDNLQKPIQALCFYKPDDSSYETVRDLLEQYKAASPRFEYRFIDLDEDPIQAKTYDVKSYSTTVLLYDTRNRKVISPTEKDFTNAIVKLTRGEIRKKLYFLTFHGERDLEDNEALGLTALKMALEESNYEVLPLNLLKEGSVPGDATALVIVGPQQDPADVEIELIRNYVVSGGNLMVFLDPALAPKLKNLIQEYGITMPDGVIIDPKGFQSILNPIVEDFPEHEITKDFNFGVVFQLACGVFPQDAPPAGLIPRIVARTSEESWVETQIRDQDMGDPVFDEAADRKGPVPIVVAVELTDENRNRTDKIEPDIPQEESIPQTGTSDPVSPAPDESKTSKILVFGDSDFINNLFVTTFPTNAALVMNSFHYIAEEKDLIAIPPKDTQSQPMHLTPGQLAAAFWIPVALIPLVILGFGGVRIYERRRNR